MISSFALRQGGSEARAPAPELPGRVQVSCTRRSEARKVRSIGKRVIEQFRVRIAAWKRGTAASLYQFEAN
jgi:hypothetical protein